MHLSTVKVPTDFGIDWPRSSVSFLISNLFVLPNFASLIHFASVSMYLVRPSPVNGPHFTWHRIYRFLYALGQSGAMDRETVEQQIFVRPSQSCQPSTRWLVVDFTSCWWLSPNYRHLTYYNFILQHRQSPKQLQNSINLPAFCSTSAGLAGASFPPAPNVVSVVVNTRVFAHGTPILFHILTSFVRIGPITTLTNSSCHGPWRGLRDPAGNSMNEIVA